jgi:hypothetical protein
MRDLGVIEGSGLRGALKADDILDAVDLRNRVVRPREKSAAFVRIQLPCVRNDFVKNVLWEAKVRHVRWSR